MQFATENLPAWLAARGLFDTASVVRGNFSIVPVERRNRGFRVQSGSGGLFIKQVRSPQPELVASALREANWYQAVAAAAQSNSPPLAGLQWMMPRFVTHDSKRHVLGVELLAAASDWNDFQRLQDETEQPERQREHDSIAIVEALARLLSELHRTSPQFASAPRLESSPDVFLIGRRATSELVPETLVTRQLAVELSVQTDIPARLARLEHEWPRRCVIHGDLRRENVLILRSADSVPELRLIDWEHVQAGDPLWDVAGAIEGALRTGLLDEFPNSAPTSARAAAVLSGPVGDAVRHFWSVYLSECEIAAELHSKAARRTAEYVACRLIQSAFEHGGVAGTNSDWCVALLQTGIDALRIPEQLASVFSLAAAPS